MPRVCSLVKIPRAKLVSGASSQGCSRLGFTQAAFLCWLLCAGFFFCRSLLPAGTLKWSHFSTNYVCSLLDIPNIKFCWEFLLKFNRFSEFLRIRLSCSIKVLKCCIFKRLILKIDFDQSLQMCLLLDSGMMIRIVCRTRNNVILKIFL